MVVVDERTYQVKCSIYYQQSSSWIPWFHKLSLISSEIMQVFQFPINVRSHYLTHITFCKVLHIWPFIHYRAHCVNLLSYLLNNWGLSVHISQIQKFLGFTLHFEYVLLPHLKVNVDFYYCLDLFNDFWLVQELQKRLRNWSTETKMNVPVLIKVKFVYLREVRENSLNAGLWRLDEI